MTGPTTQDLLQKLYPLRDASAAIAAEVAHQGQLEGAWHHTMAQLAGTRQHFATTSVRGRTATIMSAALIALGALFMVFSILWTRDFITSALIIGIGVLVLQLNLQNAAFRNVLLVIGGLLALMAIFTYFRGFLAAGILLKVIMLVLAAGAGLLGWFIVKRSVAKHATEVDQSNSVIEAHNQRVIDGAEALSAEYQASTQRLQNQQQAVRQLASGGWFPPDYLSLAAIEHFIGSLSNYKAETMGAAVLLFDQAGYQQAMLQANQQIIANQEQMISNQQQMSDQLRLANILNVAQLATQVVTAQRIGTLANEVRNVGGVLTGNQHSVRHFRPGI